MTKVQESKKFQACILQLSKKPWSILDASKLLDSIKKNSLTS